MPQLCEVFRNLKFNVWLTLETPLRRVFLFLRNRNVQILSDPQPYLFRYRQHPRAGAEDGKLTFTFRHKTLEELRAMDEKLHKAAEGKKA
jgi:hypothetical protein